MYAKKNRSAKLIALLLILALLIGGAVGGTIAWLFTETPAVVNTFTVGSISIELKETYNTLSDAAVEANKTENDTWVGKMIPGTKLAKDPHVIVSATSEDCWVFVEITKEGSVTVDGTIYGFDSFIAYDVDTAKWTHIEDTATGSKVYGYNVKIGSDLKNKELYVLKGEGTGDLQNGFVSVNSDVTKEMLEAVPSGTAAPKLTFKAYAIQSANLTDANGNAVSTAAKAWEVYKNPPTPPTEDSNT